MFFVMLLPLLLYGVPGVLALYLAFRFVRAFERRGGERNELEALRSRIAQLEEDLARNSATIAEIEEGQRFTTRLLAERAGNGTPNV
jgi:hypothetical protein